jgi:hypothetical protein
LVKITLLTNHLNIRLLPRSSFTIYRHRPRLGSLQSPCACSKFSTPRARARVPYGRACRSGGRLNPPPAGCKRAASSSSGPVARRCPIDLGFRAASTTPYRPVAKITRF